MNDSFALCLDNTDTLSLEDATIHIVYQKHILDISSGLRSYSFLYALLKKATCQLNDKMPTLSDIEKAMSIGSFGSYYLQVQEMGVSFDYKTKSHFLLSALQQKGIEVDRFVDHLDSIPYADPLPEELTLTELVLRIKYIHPFQKYSTTVIDHYAHPTNDRDSSNPHHNRQYSSPDSRPPRPSS
jgi:hypothetical protein